MTILVKAAVFIIGIYFGMRLIAALYSPIDFGYTLKTAYPVVIRRLIVWAGIPIILIYLLGSYQRVFLLGMVVYGIIYLLAYLPNRLLLAKDVRSSDTRPGKRG